MSKDLEPAEKVEPPCRIYYLQSSSGKVYRCYLKSEADKVITELEMKLAAAKLVLRLNEPKALFSNLDTMSRINHEIYVVARRERHRKYKHCLAMAEWCNSEMWRETFACFRPRNTNTKEVWRYEHKYWDKWRKIWFKLSRKFKEAK